MLDLVCNGYPAVIIRLSACIMMQYWMPLCKQQFIIYHNLQPLLNFVNTIGYLFVLYALPHILHKAATFTDKATKL